MSKMTVATAQIVVIAAARYQGGFHQFRFDQLEALRSRLCRALATLQLRNIPEGWRELALARVEDIDYAFLVREQGAAIDDWRDNRQMDDAAWERVYEAALASADARYVEHWADYDCDEKGYPRAGRGEG